jgi:hypothetical protein
VPCFLLSGKQRLAALGVWLLASAVAAGATLLALRSLVPDSANDSCRMAVLGRRSHRGDREVVGLEP